MHARVLSRVNHVQLFATPWTVAHQAPLPPDLGESSLDKTKGDKKK